MRTYLAGPCSGIPNDNRPAFALEAARLRGLGFDVVNPTEGPLLPSWAAYMRRGIGQLVTCDQVAFLPNWHGSRGACIERMVARWLQMPIHDAADLVEAL